MIVMKIISKVTSVKSIKFLLTFLFIHISFLYSFAAETDDIFFRSVKIYIVLGFISIIFIGIILFLISLERKIKRLENQININE